MARVTEENKPVTFIEWGRYDSDAYVTASLRDKNGETQVLDISVTFGKSYITVTVPETYMTKGYLPGVVSISVDNEVVKNDYVSLKNTNVASEDYIDAKIGELTKVIVLGPDDVVPPETPSGTVIVRRAT